MARRSVRHGLQFGDSNEGGSNHVDLNEGTGDASKGFGGTYGKMNGAVSNDSRSAYGAEDNCASTGFEDTDNRAIVDSFA